MPPPRRPEAAGESGPWRDARPESNAPPAEASVGEARPPATAAIGRASSGLPENGAREYTRRALLVNRRPDGGFLVEPRRRVPAGRRELWCPSSMPGTFRPPPEPAAGPDMRTRLAPGGAPVPTSSAAATPKACPTCGLRYPPEFRVCPRDAATLTEVSTDDETDDLVGTVLAGTYSIVRVVGEGGMGRVYEARHTRIGSKRFAVKVLHPEFARQPDVIERFQREAEAAAAIRSPHVVDVYDVARTPDGRPYIVGEFLEGRELADYLRESGRLDVARAARTVRQVCRGLAAAHARGVVHRDMKPENVFLTGDLEQPIAKVIDFGISKIGDAPGTALTKTGMIMGTPSYMAPEQARGERVDHRADVYAVGAILYCALTGQRPFDRGDPTATLAAVLTEEPPSPRSLVPSLPEHLELVVQRAMAKSPEARYQSVTDLEDELAPYDPESAPADPAATPPARAPLASAQGAAVRRGSATAMDRHAMEVRLARPTIVGLSVLGGLWLVWSLAAAVAGVVRIARGGGATANLTGSESAFLLSGIACALATPAALVVRHVRRVVWSNSVRAVELADRLRRPVVVALVAYGFGSLLVRFGESVLLRRAAGVAWPVWDLLLFVLSLGMAAGAFWVDERERR